MNSLFSVCSYFSCERCVSVIVKFSGSFSIMVVSVKFSVIGVVVSSVGSVC